MKILDSPYTWVVQQLGEEVELSLYVMREGQQLSLMTQYLKPGIAEELSVALHQKAEAAIES